MESQNLNPLPFNPYKHKHHFVRHIITTLLLVVFAVFAGLYFAGTGLFSPFASEASPDLLCQEGRVGDSVQQKIAKEGSYEEGYQAALDFARQRFADEGMVEYVGREEEGFDHFQASVRSVDGNNIIVEFKASVLDVFEVGMVTKTIVVSDDTVIEQRVDKSAEQLAKEEAEYKKAIEGSLDADELEKELESPQNYTIKYLKASDLKEGDEIQISTDIDIRTNDSFEASSIELLENDLELDKEEDKEPAEVAAPPLAEDPFVELSSGDSIDSAE